jgi:signal transduction histidine kinase
MLDLAALEEGTMRLAVGRVELSAVAREVLDQMRPALAEKGLAVHLEGPPVTVEGDRLRLRQILLSLVGNAAKFTETGSVTLRTGCDARCAFVEVQDTGCGIAAERLDGIFERFARTEAGGGPARRGVGLGLPVARQLAELHGGRLTVQSREGEGSLFRLELRPLRDSGRAAA